MQSQDKKAVENRGSQLLAPEENQEVFRLLGSRCKTMATTVVQLYHTQPPGHSKWVKKDAGVLCFVRDNNRKNYVFRLYDLLRKSMVWEQELYVGMEYKEMCEFLHAFEGDKCVYGFNFASEPEASEIHSIVAEKLLSKKRREARLSGEGNHVKQAPPTPFGDSTLKAVNNDHAKKTKRKRNLTKADIGVPREFRHVQHIGWDKDKGFDVNTTDQQLQQFFKKAGVSEKHLQDRETREFIYDFIQKNGGRDAVEREVRKKEPAPTPKSIPGTPVPPVPPRVAPKAPHTRIAPPPPTTTGQPPPPRPQYQPRTGNIPPPPPENAPPAPPPLPPPSDNFAPPPPPLPPPGDFPSELHQNNNVSSSFPAHDDAKSALLESIRNKPSLKPVDMTAAVERKPAESGGGGRDDMFKEIIKGVQLKPVEEREIKPQTPNNEGLDLAGALKRALEGRRPVIDSDGSDTDSSSNDDGWDA